VRKISSNIQLRAKIQKEKAFFLPYEGNIAFYFLYLAIVKSNAAGVGINAHFTILIFVFSVPYLRQTGAAENFLTPTVNMSVKDKYYVHIFD